MFLGKTLAMIIPVSSRSLPWEQLIAAIPDWVDAAALVPYGDPPPSPPPELKAGSSALHFLQAPLGREWGLAVIEGYKWALEREFQVVVVAPDGPLPEDDFQRLVEPVARGLADYCKGNRFGRLANLASIPSLYKAGNLWVSSLGKIASGYWHVSDVLCGHTAINHQALNQMQLEAIFPTLGSPLDILVKLNVAQMRVAEVTIIPRFSQSRRSLGRTLGSMVHFAWMAFGNLRQRITYKYILLDAHPLAFFYIFAVLFLLASVGLSIHLAIQFVLSGGYFKKPALIIWTLVVSMGLQGLVLSFVLDFMLNRELFIRLPRLKGTDDKPDPEQPPAS